MPAIDWAPFSPKCLDAIAHCDAFINILEGAVRSSKTVAANVAFIDLLQQSPHKEFVISGADQNTLYRNVLSGNTGLLNILGTKRASYVGSARGGAQLRVKWPGRAVQICYCIGAHTRDAETRFRGPTFGGWLGDEVTLYPEEVVKQGINRLSLPGAKAIWTFNPDSPFHYLYTEFIALAGDKGYRKWHFELDDNWSLSETYKANLRAAYTGLWYRRMVLGEWVAAEGAIYDMLDPAKHVVKAAPALSRCWTGADYGTNNPTVYLRAGVGPSPLDGKPALFFDKEYRWDSQTAGREKTDLEYSRDFIAWSKGMSYEWFFVDPSAASFILQLYRDNVPGLARADNTVIDGIRNVSSLIGADRLFFTEDCAGTIAEMSAYVWDPRARLLHGQDEPLKRNDHGCDVVRYVCNGTKHVWGAWLGGIR